MKNYRKIMPIILIFLSFLAWYTMVGDAVKLELEYKGYIENARSKVEDGIFVEALKQYQNAMKMHESLELVSEIGEALVLEGKRRDIINWGEYMINTYPTNVEGFDYMIEQYWREESYNSFYETYYLAEERNLLSKSTEKKREEIEYIYDVDYRKFNQVHSLNGGLYPVETEQLWGYTNQIGEVVIECIYIKAGGFLPDFASVTKQSEEEVFIDKERNKVIALPADIKVEEVGNIGNEIYPILFNNQYSYYDSKKKLILEGFEEATTFNQGVAAVKDEKGWKFIKMNGDSLGSGVYEDIILDDQGISFREKRGFGKIEEGYVMINETGSQVSKSIYQDAKVFMGGEYAAVKIDDLWGFVDTSGKMIIEPFYQDANSFSQGLAAVKIGNKWGFIDEKGEIAIEPIFDGAKHFNQKDGAYIKEDGSWSLLQLLRSNY